MADMTHWLICMTHALQKGQNQPKSKYTPGVGWLSQTLVADSSTKPWGLPAFSLGSLVCNLGLGHLSPHLRALLS